MDRGVLSGSKLRLAGLSLVVAAQALAGSSVTTSLTTHQGAQEPAASGDFVGATTAGGGLDSPGHYFIEVPPSQTRLVVGLFDPDIGQGGTAEVAAQRDRNRTDFDTNALYTLTDPAGVVQARLKGSVAGPADNAWYNLYDTTAPRFINSATAIATVATTSLAIAVPGGTLANDLLILTVAHQANGAINTPAGWTLVNEGACGSNSCELGIFWKLASASEAASYTATWANPNRRAVGSILAYRNVNPTTPLDGTAAVATGNTNAPTAPSITTTVANALAVHVYGANDNSLSLTPYPATDAGRFNVDAIDVSSGGADAPRPTVGGTGTAAFALTSTEQWRVVSLALRPAAAPAAPLAGHWALDVDMTDAVNPAGGGGEDINALGIRANDGNATSGGTEFNVYYDSHSAYGVNPPDAGTGTNTRSFSYFPYITSGCTATQANFDWDANIAGSQGAVSLTSRTGAFAQAFADGVMSDNNAWTSLADGTITRWTTDTDATEYGIWSMTASITSYVSGGAQNGNYGDLYFLKDFPAPADPPAATTNPSANAFRVYLPTDAGGTPVEPYVEQQVRFGGASPAGPNPPVVGQTSVFTVTLRVVNPTTSAVTFSAANLVTANVPGGVVLYGGTPQASQGTVTAQPAVGGSGTVSWNPGTVAAGQTAILAYRVRVTPLAGSPNPIPVTGTPASNGTTATYVDETGNATQARAKYTFGPLCQLAVSRTLLTAVVISHLETRETSGGVAVRWETASEVDAIGFDVYRWEPSSSKWLKINDRLVPALVGAPQGGRYEVLDRGASANTKYWYSIRETESAGSGRAYGPFQAGPAAGRDTATGALEPARPKRPTAALLRVSASREAIASTGNWTLGRFAATPALKIGVRNDGVVFLSREEIASHFGTTPAAASLLIAIGRYDLTSHGARIAWTPASGNRGILFYGQAIDSPYSRDNVYWLRSGAGLMVASVAAPAPAPVRGGTFVDTLHAELDTFAATLVSTKPDSDYWYWDGLIAGDATLGRKTFTIAAPHAVAGGSPSLVVTLASANTNGVANEHHMIVRLNGTAIGETSWAGIKTQQVRLPFGAGLLHDGANVIELEAVLGNGVANSFVYLDSFDLTYSRDFSATNSALKFTSNKARNVTVTGFADAGVMVLDVSNPRVPRRIKNVAVSDTGDGFRASLVPASAQALYVATSESGWQAPAWTEGDQPSSLKAASGAEYVVVTTADLMDAAERLASLHASTMSTMIVDIKDVYDEFSDGLVDPRALDAFVKQAAQHWSTPARYVVIAGRGNFDYKNIYGLGGNLVPPIMVSTPKGLFASDTALGDVNGDGVPEVAVGRIPVLSSDELDVYVDKVRAYESALTPETARQALMLADAPDNGTDFSVASDQIAAGVPSGYEAARIYLQTGGDIAVPRDELFARLASGADLVNYTGHGALDRLSGEGLLTSDDVPALDNVQTPVLTALSCTINRFEVPGFAPLGEQVVKKAGGGFVASWAPTGLSEHEQATLLGKAFYRDLGVHPNAPLGDTVNRAFKSYMSLGGVTWMPAIYSLIGDPALTLKKGVEVEDTGTGTGTPSTE